MKVLLTGVSGQVGAHLASRLRANGHEVIGLDRAALDLTDTAAIEACVRAHAPDLVINPAAYTAVDKAQTEPELAHAINADAPGAFARACKRENIPFLHFSTDYVFDGNATDPWRETDLTSPISTYGATKLAGETAIAQSGCDALIFRTSWVYSTWGKNFLLTMQRLASEKDFLRVVCDQHGTPNWAGTLADAVVHVVNRGDDQLRANAGVYHLSSRGETTWHGFASAIVAAGARQIPVQAISTAEFPTPAQRPAYSVLDPHKFETTFQYEMPQWQDGLRACLASASAGALG